MTRAQVRAPHGRIRVVRGPDTAPGAGAASTLLHPRDEPGLGICGAIHLFSRSEHMSGAG
ncbi:hypothetical protein AMK27_39580 [Streptomyces sp. CB02009]|nr:hypothetical protein AMK27_39580 [Streptomyces sp. CB02009]